MDNFENFKNKHTIIQGSEGMFHSISGEDYKKVKSFPNSNIWTVIEHDNIKYIIPGFTLKNRVNYVLTEQEWQNSSEMYLL